MQLFLRLCRPNSKVIAQLVSSKSTCSTLPLQQNLRQMRAYHYSATSCDPHPYTAGHWLKNDERECKARYVKFDMDRLRAKVLSCSEGASEIVSFTKKEGNSSKAFIFSTDNGKRLVAKVPTSIAGPQRLITNSEVATMKYMQMHTKIPIPEVRDWNDDPSNDVGCEYIISDNASGVPLNSIWHQLDIGKQMRCIGAIAKHVAEMTELKFGAYGSLYFHTAFAADARRTQRVDSEFCIGPHCGNRYWRYGVHDTRFSHIVEPGGGPWTDLSAYCDGLINVGLSRLPPNDCTAHDQKSFQGTSSEHTHLFEQAREVLQKLVEDDRIRQNSAPTLPHPDLHLQNIFVNPNDPIQITGFIDWQATGITPALEHTKPVIDLRTGLLQTADEERNKLIAGVFEKAYDGAVKAFIPRLARARALDDGLLRLFWYCHRTWLDGACVLKDELIELSRRWQDLGLSCTCPFPLPSEAELQQQRQKYDSFLVALDLKKRLVEHLETNGEGWVASELWERKREMLAEVYGTMLAEVSEPDSDLTVDELNAIWPFDKPEEV